MRRRRLGLRPPRLSLRHHRPPHRHALVTHVCLINRYEPGTKLHLHIDRDEHDYAHPIVSASLGLPAMFMWGGPSRTDKPRRYPVQHGDVVVWGGPSRRHYHGISPLKPGTHELTGPYRLNLTFRKALK